MAAVVLQHAQNASIRMPYYRSFAMQNLTFAFWNSVRTAQWSMTSSLSWLEFFPSILLAVPKSKTSHSRKAMRAANKGLKDKRNIVNCPGCGSPKLAHHQCSNCYSFLSRMWKGKTGGQNGGDS